MTALTSTMTTPFTINPACIHNQVESLYSTVVTLPASLFLALAPLTQTLNMPHKPILTIRGRDYDVPQLPRQ